MDFRKDLTYGDYLHLEPVLNSQHRLSDHHDEMLFIIIHQTSELWMKLILHEMQAAIDCIRNNQLDPSFKMLSRVSRIQQQLIQSWDVLSTLTPSEYMEFRDKLGYSSGFQSYQNRLIEFSLGHKNADLLKVFSHQPDVFNRLQYAIQQPSIYDMAIRALAARGLSIDHDYLERDWTQDYQANSSVEAAWLTVYRDTEKYWDLYELAEKLVDIEDRQQQWRYNHMKTVERIIGYKRGTGGSSGVHYLRQRLEHRFFPELWSIRTLL
ncbi:tryptophan 2,3-dioxygenase [Ammoniphilus sp. CFH 90114]|uniref:tryptophan 2,3-dioxygenase n=1 Tax=Ammoniphilus sp. CFH 90114 TaxID=2493665 RepID=UPI001F0C2429|nr:tryptophan 2,3-dioxygenase [Ammoniphilus sp. CFH 90114]